MQRRAAVRAQVREVASRVWAPSHSQAPGCLTLEAFDWTSPGPGRSRARLRTVMSNASLLELPRGTHLLRVHADDQLPHAATFYSRSPMQVEDYKEVRARGGRTLSLRRRSFEKGPPRTFELWDTSSRRACQALGGVPQRPPSAFSGMPQTT